MKVYDAASIRNVALVGHTSSGKTQLASAILAVAGMVNRFGKVDEGTTVTDYDEEEIARKHTLHASPAFAEWSRQKINIIDTPGVGNFLSEVRSALQIADAAILTDDELVEGLRSATASAKLFPLVCTSALANIGVPQLLDAIAANVPPPSADDKQPPQAFVWKTIADPFAGRITMFRVMAG